jgi:hypothetical protein
MITADRTLRYHGERHGVLWRRKTARSSATAATFAMPRRWTLAQMDDLDRALSIALRALNASMLRAA